MTRSSRQAEVLHETPPQISPLPEEQAPGPTPIATIVLIAVLLLVTIAFWMMVLGVQQGRA